MNSFINSGIYRNSMVDSRYGGPSSANSLWKGVEWTGSKIGLSGAQSRQYFPYAIVGLIIIIVVFFLLAKHKDKLKGILPKSSGGGKSSGSKWSLGSSGSSSSGKGSGKLKKWFSGDPLGVSGDITGTETDDASLKKMTPEEEKEHKKKRSQVIELIVGYLKEFKGEIESSFRNLEDKDYQDVIDSMNRIITRIRDHSRGELNTYKGELGKLFSAIVNDFLNNLEKNAETVIVMVTGQYYDRALYYLNEMKASIEKAIPNVEKQKRLIVKTVIIKEAEPLKRFNIHYVEKINKELSNDLNATRLTKTQYEKVKLKVAKYKDL